MNTVSLDAPLRSQARWTKFADQLGKEMEEYELDGVTVFLRELTPDELAAEDSGEVLSYNPSLQRIEFAVAADKPLPAAWKVADRIDGFLNPAEG